MQSVYVITYSQVDLSKSPTRKPSFNAPTGKDVQWVYSTEKKINLLM